MDERKDYMAVKHVALLILRVGVILLTLKQGEVTVAAWGADGHHITCLLAEPLLTPAASAAVRSLLPEYSKGSLASLCTWPDDIRWMWKWQWTGPLHYIDTPDFYCNYNYARDCHNEKGQLHYCVAGGINNYSSQLLTYHASALNMRTSTGALQQQSTAYNLTEALLFLSHFVGDIHQPLHVGFTGDAGGNTIILHWYTRKYNLHHVWDNEFIARARDYLFDKDLSAFTRALALNLTTNWLDESAEWAKCPDGTLACPDLCNRCCTELPFIASDTLSDPVGNSCQFSVFNDTNCYASESISLACKWAYRNATPGSILTDEYFLSRLPIVEQQLARGGVRLAATLNRIFSPESASLF